MQLLFICQQHSAVMHDCDAFFHKLQHVTAIAQPCLPHMISAWDASRKMVAMGLKYDGSLLLDTDCVMAAPAKQHYISALPTSDPAFDP